MIKSKANFIVRIGHAEYYITKAFFCPAYFLPFSLFLPARNSEHHGFFKTKPKVGRPRSVPETHGRPRIAFESGGDDQMEIPAYGERAAASAATSGHDSDDDEDDLDVSMRSDLSKGEGRIKMEQADAVGKCIFVLRQIR
jgi:hypothetical protein